MKNSFRNTLLTATTAVTASGRRVWPMPLK